VTKPYDIVCIGAGSNTLVLAAYMAKAGKSVLLLEKNDQAGGGVISVEIAPGFTHDPHATGYISFQANPAIKDDELGLFSRFGLETFTYEASFASIFESGEGLVTYTDIDRSCEGIAKYSQKDADSYRAFVAKAKQILPILGRGSSTPPLPTGRFFSLLEQSEIGRELQSAMFKSAYDMIESLFETVEVKLHYLKWCAEVMENPETNGTGIVMYQLCGLAHTYEALGITGGSKNLTNALVRCIERYGGEIRLNSEVAKVDIESGNATGVTLATGEHIAASDAIVGCIHPWHLDDVVPEVDPNIAARARQTKLSGHGALNQQIALTELPEFKAGSEYRDAMCVEYVPLDLDGVRKTFDQYRFGEIPKRCVSPMTMLHSLKDPSRAPEGQCAMYLYHFAPLELKEGGIEAWSQQRETFADAIWEAFASFTTNMDQDKIIARLIETPLEHHRHSNSMVNGDIIGLGTTIGQLMGQRPIPELANYRIPGLEKLYLAGPFMHPGGTVLFGGRATAIKMCQDMDIDLHKVFEFI